MKRRAAILAHLGLLALALYFAVFAAAHPGRLDKRGCHVVSAKGYTYKDGRTLPPGERHCHRALGELTLDGSERLDDDAPTPPRPAPTRELPPRPPRTPR